MPFMTDIDSVHNQHKGPRYIRLELPMPPSVNKFTARFGNSSNDVVKWRKASNKFLMSKGRHPGTVKGPVDVTIIWDREYKAAGRDVDNQIKPLLDYLQDNLYMDNDRNVESLYVMWGKAAEGCIVEIEKHMEPSDARSHKKDSVSVGNAGPTTGL